MYHCNCLNKDNKKTTIPFELKNWEGIVQWKWPDCKVGVKIAFWSVQYFTTNKPTQQTWIKIKKKTIVIKNSSWICLKNYIFLVIVFTQDCKVTCLVIECYE